MREAAANQLAAAFLRVTAKQDKETAMADIPNYFEIGTPDPEEAQRFYGSLFDWTFGEPSPPATAW